MNKKLWIEDSKKAGIDELEIYEAKSAGTTIDIFESEVSGYKLSQVDGICIRGSVNGKMAQVFLEEVNDEDRFNIYEQIKTNAAYITSDDEVEILAPQSEYPKLPKENPEIFDAGNDEKIALLKQLESCIMKQDERVKQVALLRYIESVGYRSIVNSKGMDLSDEGKYAFIDVDVIIQDGEHAQFAFNYLRLKNLADLDVEKFASELVNKGLKKLNSQAIASGSYQLIMERDAMNDLLSSLTNIFNGERAYKGLSVLKDRLNQQIFDEKITIKDEPLLAGELNSACFDDEGVACYNKTIVDHGKLVTYLHNTKSAKLMNTSSTGNGFKAGYAGSVNIGTTNFYIEKGEDDFDTLVSKVSKGIIVTEIQGMHAGINPNTTEFSLQSNGFYIEDGKIVKPIQLFTIAGNFIDLMNKVESIGSDMKFGINGIGTPSILFKEIQVSGSEG